MHGINKESPPNQLDKEDQKKIKAKEKHKNKI